jgi:acyl-coenzyme A thioesterase PaaI-like protein
MKAIQDFYDNAFNHCYGCGTLNGEGLHIRSYWVGDEAVCEFRPEPYHVAVPGYVYGGLIASLIDCHGIGTAAAATCVAEGREPGTGPAMRYVTASLRVEYLKPTPIDSVLELRARAKSVEGRKVLVEVSLFAGGDECAKGEVLAVRMSDKWLENER